MLSFLQSAALATATGITGHYGKPWYASTMPGSGHGDCRAIAGVFSFVETVQNYDNSALGTVGAGAHCAGGIGFLYITEDCAWQYKLVANEPNEYCVSAQGWDERSIARDQFEFWEVPAAASVTLGTSNIASLVFTIEKVAGVGATYARHLQGVSKTTEGCELAFNGWAVQRASLAECTDSSTNSNHDSLLGVFYKKRHAQLTSEGSSVDVSDVKDALGKIAAALPEWTSSHGSSSSSSSSSAPGPACAEIAGVYQIVETVNEYDSSELGGTGYLVGGKYGRAQCNGGVGYLEIREGCAWSYKKVENGEKIPRGDTVIYDVPKNLNEADATPVYRCIDDSGAGATGIFTHEGEFCKINRVMADNSGNDVKFAVDQLEGGADAAWRIHGIIETSKLFEPLPAFFFGQRGPGCDVAFEGWRVARAELTPCRDRCYSSENGDFEAGYAGFHSSYLKAIPGAKPAVGNATDTLATGGRYAIAANPVLANTLFESVACDGLCLVASGLTLTTVWEQMYARVGDASCCPSQSYELEFDVANVGDVPFDVIPQRLIAGFPAIAMDVAFVNGLPAASTTLTLPSAGAAAFQRVRTAAYFIEETAEFRITMSHSADIPNGDLPGIVLDNIRVICAGHKGLLA